MPPRPAANVRPLIGIRTTLLRAYPHLARIEIRVVEESAEVGWKRECAFNDDDVPSTVSCGNRRCRQGGYDISSFVYFLVAGRKTRDEISIRCDGHEGSPKGRRHGDPCTNRARIAATAEFKVAAASSTP